MERPISSGICRLFAFILGIAIVLALVHQAGFARVGDILSQISPSWIVVAIAIYATSWIFRTWRLRLLAANSGMDIPSTDLFKLHVSGYALNILLPAKLGDAATIGFLNMRGINLGQSAAIVLQTRVMDLLALILLSAPALILFSEMAGSEWMRSSIIMAVILVMAPLVLGSIGDVRSLSSRLDDLKARTDNMHLQLLIEKAKDAYEGYRKIVSDRRLLLVTVIASLSIWLLDSLTCYAVSIAVGSKASMMAIVLAISIGNVGKSAPATPGSIGIYESIVTAALVLFGISYDVAIATAILDHALKNIFTLLLGVPAIIHLGKSRISLFSHP